MCSMHGAEEMWIERLGSDLVRVAEELSRRMASWLSLVEEFDRRDGARRWGFRGSGMVVMAVCGRRSRGA
jgi:hypothetical protein